MNNLLLESCLKLELLLNKLNWKFCFIGGVALQRWGEPRFTADADLSLLTGFSSEEKFIQELSNHYSFRRPDGADFALRYRVLLLKDVNGVSLDISLAGLPFEERSIDRSSKFNITDNIVITTCSAEDLLVHKAFANRDKDWADIYSILQRSNAGLNYDLIRSELKVLVELKEEPEIMDRINNLFKKYR